MSALKVNKTVQHYTNLVLGGFKVAGVDNLSSQFLMDEAKVLATSVTDLCNLSTTSGKFPDSCKLAKLKLIHKYSSLTEASNCRPISLLPLNRKVIEKVIHDQTGVFLNSRNLLYNYQSGFRKKIFTNFCLSYLNSKGFQLRFDNRHYFD